MSELINDVISAWMIDNQPTRKRLPRTDSFGMHRRSSDPRTLRESVVESIEFAEQLLINY